MERYHEQQRLNSTTSPILLKCIPIEVGGWGTWPIHEFPACWPEIVGQMGRWKELDFALRYVQDAEAISAPLEGSIPVSLKWLRLHVSHGGELADLLGGDLVPIDLKGIAKRHWNPGALRKLQWLVLSNIDMHNIQGIWAAEIVLDVLQGVSPNTLQDIARALQAPRCTFCRFAYSQNKSTEVMDPKTLGGRVFSTIDCAIMDMSGNTSGFAIRVRDQGVGLSPTRGDQITLQLDSGSRKVVMDLQGLML
ncbi:hypothetical protein FRB98_007012 [Tulasnella sp. 332]|nr:hypothetical protein FRB98_007012 [Tulasnella sp. 332]